MLHLKVCIMNWFCKMKNIFLYISYFILFFSCNKIQQTKPIQKIEKEYIDDSLVYKVINDLLEIQEFKEYKPEYMINCSYILDFVIEEDKKEFYILTEKYFGENDTLNIFNQIEKSKISYFKEGEIKNTKMVEYDLTKISKREQFDSLNQSTKQFQPYFTISYPIFNKDRTMVHLSYGNDGSTKKLFMRKIKNKWKI